MLFNPEWEVQTKPDVFSLESLIAWLEKQPTDRTYCYQNTGECLLHQYFTAQCFPLKSVAGTYIRLPNGKMKDLSKAFCDIASGTGGDGFRHTFGAALTRARAALAAS